jgi:hypothetical protein
MGIDEQARNKEGEGARAGEGVDGVEFIPHVLSGLRVGAMGVRVERHVTKVDAASFRDGTDPPIRSNRFGRGGSPVPGTGKAGMGIDRYAQVDAIARGAPDVVGVVEFDAQCHGTKLRRVDVPSNFRAKEKPRR